MEQFDTRSFEEMMAYQPTELEELENIYCEMHKDVYGVKARWYRAESVEQARKDLASLEVAWEAAEKARIADEQQAIIKFCKRIEQTIKSGAGNRETALRWIHEADGSNGDDEYLCYLNGLPYGFFRKAA